VQHFCRERGKTAAGQMSTPQLEFSLLWAHLFAACNAAAVSCTVQSTPLKRKGAVRVCWLVMW
jgi:hypothetical protein